jgi:maltooligosyltrehalose synthase
VLLDEIQRREEGDRRGFIRGELAALGQAAPNAGALKMFVMRAALRFRRARRTIFEQGAYLPLVSEGARQRQVIAFARHRPEGSHDGSNDGSVVVIASRFFAELPGTADSIGESRAPVGPEIWGETRVALAQPLPRGRYHEILSDRIVETDGEGRLPLGEVFAELPFALLEPAR